MTSSPTSPLAEASSASLDEYFARKPPYDAATLAAIKAEFRRMRTVWQKAEAEQKPVKAKKAAKPKVQMSTDIDIFSSDSGE